MFEVWVNFKFMSSTSQEEIKLYEPVINSDINKQL